MYLIYYSVKTFNEKLPMTFHEQLRILQFNNQNLHNAKIIHITLIMYI